MSPQSNLSLYDDFVLVSEFSELEGPLPLVIISQDDCIDLKQDASKLKTLGLQNFDLNAFALRVVSVDRGPGEEKSETFSIPDDTQVYFTDTEHQYSAFTHHLTLFDIHARGYVHPVALSYITRDSSKMILKFEDLMDRFSRASSHLKRGNYANFMLDLKCRLLDLEYTKLATKHLSKEAIDQAATVIKYIIDTLEGSYNAIEPPDDYKPVCIDTLYPVPNFERKLRSLAQLCRQSNKVISLVYSMMEPSSSSPPQERLTFSRSVMHDMYDEAIRYIQETTRINHWKNVHVESREPTAKGEPKASSSAPSASSDSEIYPILFTASQLWNQTQDDIKLLKTLYRYKPIIVDVIFSLMTGRIVIVQGSLKSKEHVQEVVQALSVFVPGQSRKRHQIIGWLEEEALTHVDSIKLVGMDKYKVSSSMVHIESSSCVFDVDAKNGSLHSSPVYVEGYWIHQFLDRMTLFSTDASYLAYLHTMFMTISLKAFIYHHLYASDEFQLENIKSSHHTQKGYTSDNNSEAGSSTVSSSSTTLSRKWSQRLLGYLKKHEDQEEEEDYSEDNQETVTPHRLMQEQQSTLPLADLFHQRPRRNSVSTIYSMSSCGSDHSGISDRNLLHQELTANDHALFEEDEEEEEEEDGIEEYSHRRKQEQVGPDGVSLIERRGRRFLQDKLRVYGDDQTIVVVSDYMALACQISNMLKVFSD
ncbi:hypothetical protein CU097_005718 [Rhizopus azygosporus]|uniref:UDENN FLCN/SMCR8-type domain-containing protein n=1 Tax=Rhizopus azygosporus TaxID=86630 RepID=A0A367JVH7_RHIAZ|nr:hypothetical protein CU097_005718 [Rhizopus azygosporus]